MREEEGRTALYSMADAHAAVCPRAAQSDGGRPRLPARTGPKHVRPIRWTCVQPVRSNGRARGRVERDRAGRPPDRVAAWRFSPSARSDHRRLRRTVGMLSDSSDRTNGSDGATSDRAVIMPPRRPRKNLTV